MKSFFNCFKWIAVYSTFAFLIGCATATTPNKPYSGSLPDSFSKLAESNPKLGEELKKLPEIRDGISQSETKALMGMTKLYGQMPKKFDSAFRQMYMEGKPNIRKYCSPLQAIFWLIEDEKIKDAREIISDYGLEKLLDKAWPKEREEHVQRWKLRLEEARKVEASCTDEMLKEKIVDFKRKNGEKNGVQKSLSKNVVNQL